MLSLTVACTAEEDVAPATDYQEVIPLNQATIDRADNLYELAKENYSSNVENAHFYANELLVLSQNSGYKSGLGNAHQALGIVHNQKRNYKKALEHSLAATAIKDMLGQDDDLSKLYNNIAYIYFKNESYDKAIDYYQRSLDLKITSGVTQASIGKTLRNIALTLQQQGKFEDALAKYDEALAVYQEIDSESKIALIYSNMGYLYMEMKQYDKADVTYRKSLDIRTGLDDQMGVAKTLANMSGLYVKTMKLDEALALIEESKQIQDQLRLPDIYGETLLKYGEIYTLKGENNKAVTYLQNGESVLMKMGNSQDLVIVYDLLSENHRAIGDNSKANYYYSLANKLIQDIDHEQQLSLNLKREEIAMAEASFEDFQDDLVIASLMSQCNNNVMSFLALAFLLFSVVFGYSIMYLWKVN